MYQHRLKIKSSIMNNETQFVLYNLPEKEDKMQVNH